MFDRDAVARAVARHGAVVRVVIAGVAGSSPREAGASMLVWADGQSGTIGGGALEWQAVQAAWGVLASGGSRVDRVALGPSIGQCCGGAVVLVLERWDAARLSTWAPQDGLLARPLAGGALPLAVARVMARARDRGVVPGITLADGWLVEPAAACRRDLWVWGAGHVGRAVVGVLAPLPDLAITWVDTGAERFPPAVLDGIRVLATPAPGAQVASAPRDADHLILTYSHALDLDLCHRLLNHGFGACGLIGSATKWARFRARLASLGHPPEAIARIDCPIGDPSLGKHPQAIAIGVAVSVMTRSAVPSARDLGREKRA